MCSNFLINCWFGNVSDRHGLHSGCKKADKDSLDQVFFTETRFSISEEEETVQSLNLILAHREDQWKKEKLAFLSCLGQICLIYNLKHL